MLYVLLHIYCFTYYCTTAGVYRGCVDRLVLEWVDGGGWVNLSVGTWVSAFVRVGGGPVLFVVCLLLSVTKAPQEGRQFCFVRYIGPTLA